MAVTLEDFAKHLDMPGVPADTEELERCLATAHAMITPHLIITTESGFTADQMSALDFSILKLAGDLWRWKDATGGMFTFGDAVDTPTYMPRDLLDSIWPTLTASGLVGLGSIA